MSSTTRTQLPVAIPPGATEVEIRNDLPDIVGTRDAAEVRAAAEAAGVTILSINALYPFNVWSGDLPARAVALADYAAACGAQAQTFELKRGAADLVPDTLVAAKSMPAGGAQETRAVHFAWALEADAALTQAAPHHAESREFWTQLDASQAKSGWDFTPTTDGALVRISLRQSGKARSLAASDLQLRVDGQVRDAASVIEHLAGDAELKSVGTHFSEGTVVFQLAKGLAGSGGVAGDTAQIATRVLDPDNGRELCQPRNRIGLQVRDGPSRHVVQDDRQLGVLAHRTKQFKHVGVGERLIGHRREQNAGCSRLRRGFHVLKHLRGAQRTHTDEYRGVASVLHCQLSHPSALGPAQVRV